MMLHSAGSEKFNVNTNTVFKDINDRASSYGDWRSFFFYFITSLLGYFISLRFFALSVFGSLYVAFYRGFQLLN